MTINSIWKNPVTTLCLLLFVAPQALCGQATPPAATSTASPAVVVVGALAAGTASWTSNKSSIVLGWTFRTGAMPLTVTSLGYVDDGAVGTAASHKIGIYDNVTRELLSPVVIVTTTGEKPVDGTNPTFTYVKLAKPLTLAAGSGYTIAATTVGTGWFEHLKDVRMQYGIAFASVHCVFQFDSDTLVFPGTTHPPNDPALLGPNFLAK